MDVEKLIDRLKNYSIKDKALLNLQTVKDAAEALTTLQIELKAMRGAANSYKAENARLESELEKAKMARPIELTGKGAEAFALAAELSETKQEFEKVKAERDAALHDMRRVGMSDDFCTFCAYCCINGEPVYRPEEEYLAHCEKCDENYSQFEWRGPQKGV